VVSKRYLRQLKDAIKRIHGCACRHVKSVPVHETFQGETVWQGDVEIFDLSNHPQTKQCFAWSHLDGDNDELTNVVTVLAIPPVTTPKDAVRAAIVAQISAK
jgi:hypothetical protein